MGFIREDYTHDITEKGYFETTPASETAARQQFQEMFDNILAIVNGLKTALEKITSDSETGNLSATENIGGKAIETAKGCIAAGTLYSQLAAIKVIVDAAKEGELYENAINNTFYFLDGVITDAKLAADIKIIGSETTWSTFFTEDAVISMRAALNYIAGIIGTAALTTTATDLKAAINELKAGRALLNGEVMLSNLGSDIPGIKYGTLTNPPEETYPAGTIYVQYTE